MLRVNRFLTFRGGILAPNQSIRLVSFLSALALSACVDNVGGAFGGGPTTPAQPSSEECNILQVAASQMSPQSPDQVAVLSGCPGPFAARSPNGNLSHAITRRAAETPVPDRVRRRGLSHERLFSYMLLRGVPFEIVTSMAETPLYAQVARGFS